MVANESATEEVWNVIDAAQSEGDNIRANILFEHAERLARDIIAKNPSDADACYAIALSWYHRWLPGTERRRHVYTWLRKAGSLAPDHPWVPLYLGYQHFDDHEYSEALKAFEQVDREYFASIEHHWRNLKTEELILCCRVLDDGPVIDICLLRELVSAYIAADPVDRPVPSELVHTLAKPENQKRFNSSESDVSSEMCRLIVGIEDANVFKTELAQFESVSQSAA